MIHYTCDRCKRSINPETDLRYVVEIDIRLAEVRHSARQDEHDDVDQLAELHDQLQREMNADCIGLSSVEEPVEQADTEVDEGPEQFDLCEQCHEVFVNNPLGKEVAIGLGFSNN